MLTRVLVVQPLFSVVLDESNEPVNSQAKPVCAASGPIYDANGQLLAALQKLIAAMPTLLPMILQIITLFGAPAPAASTEPSAN